MQQTIVGDEEHNVYVKPDYNYVDSIGRVPFLEDRERLQISSMYFDM